MAALARSRARSGRRRASAAPVPPAGRKAAVDTLGNRQARQAARRGRGGGTRGGVGRCPGAARPPQAAPGPPEAGRGGGCVTLSSRRGGSPERCPVLRRLPGARPSPAASRPAAPPSSRSHRSISPAASRITVPRAPRDLGCFTLPSRSVTDQNQRFSGLRCFGTQGGQGRLPRLRARPREAVGERTRLPNTGQQQRGAAEERAPASDALPPQGHPPHGPRLLELYWASRAEAGCVGQLAMSPERAAAIPTNTAE